ncbi:MAG TPA: YibE/F family protein [Candidatus Atribacteria bacterium]|nr:YibE/F family protein [Candidatus Atribacteria bacterium]
MIMSKKQINIFLWIFIFFIASLLFYYFMVYNRNSSVDNKNINYVRAKVLEVISSDLTEEGNISGVYIGTQELKIEILSGKFKGQKLILTNSRLHGDLVYDVVAEDGMEIVLAVKEREGQPPSFGVDTYARDKVLYILIFLFIFVLIGVGRIKGLMALISLIITGLLIAFFMLPLMFRGYSPILLAIITASIVIFLSLMLIGGFNKKSLAAIIGTSAGVVIAGIISLISGKMAHLTGITGEASEQLIYIVSSFPINIKGIMFAGIIISSLGAVMDVGMSIASVVFEIHNRSPELSRAELFKSGMNVGKDIMGTMANTLILAFTGASLSIMILLMAYNMPYFRAINLNTVSTEIIQGLSGSIGLILTVPITSIVSALFISNSSRKNFNND